ncbi:helix-hairpin-helix domain-containing protein [Halorubrum ezzemoulense]|uniref:helix-hairpin-helix domain-containing protein n=1 Tax=Halorubrum ezzemoulense TaxID=337243 RepID=UPI00232E8681|nr:helix-hairpin-helix domain-containing protein [Halorubrum ezzemoulense]MDB2283693.1 helix-hairpin-helix domain-containing protein [Halorubrum ezzemoulense]
MASDELDATTDIVALAEHVDGLGQSVARRLDDAGIETVADILIADEGALTDVPYVSELRAGLLREAADEIADDPEADPLVDSIEVVLEATLGEKLQITLAERDAWANAWNVIEAPDPVEWESGDDDNWHTRRLRMSESASGTAKEAREFDLVLAGDEIRVEDPPVKRQSAQPDAASWRVESVGAVGRVTTSSLVQLQSDDDKEEAKPEGDDTWRQYQHRGETA